MKKISFSLLLIGIAITSKAQKIDTVYFNANWEKTNNLSYNYFRIAVQKNNLFLVKDYYKSNQLQMKGVFKSLEKEIKHGDFVWYFPNGRVKQKSYYENDSLISVKSFTNDGKLITGGFTADVYMYGTYTENNLPQFPGGETELVKFVKNNLKYTEEMRKEDVSGSITVKFTISKTGEINNITVKKSLSLNLDNEAIRILKLMPKWRPAVENGNIVSRKGTLIFNFNPNQKSD